MVVSFVRLRPCVVGIGLHVLQWKMSSWLELGRCMRFLHVLRRRWVVRVASGGCMMGLLRVEGIWCVVGGVVMWGGSVVLTGFYRWVLSWRVGSGLVRGRGSVGCVRSFAGREW